MGRSICIDIDGTMTNPYFFLPYLNKITGKNISDKDYTSINWNKIFGSEFSDIYDSFDDKFTYVYEEAYLMDGVKEVIDELILSGDEVHYVTARSRDIDSVTKSWIDSQGLDGSKVVSLSGNLGKVETAKKLRCDIFIEDDPENAINLSKEGFKVILFDTNYNKEIDGENITRVGNWKEIRNILLQ